MNERPATRRNAAITIAALSLLVSPASFSGAAEPANGQRAQQASESGAPVQSSDPAQELNAIQGVRREANVEGTSSQARIEEISDETEALFTKYSNALRQIDSIRIYNQQMRDLIRSQDAELVSLQDQLDRVEEVGRSVTPLMLRMVDAIEAFTGLDVPFLLKERTERVAALRKLMSRADVTTAEKYRSIMEAYQIENEYGRTIEAYRSTLASGDREITVDFLRFGRIALVYQSLDESEAGVWNRQTKSWEKLDSSYRSSIRQGLRIARKQAAPDLIRLPLPAATDAEGVR